MCRPPARTVILCAQHVRSGNDYRLCECRELLHHAEHLAGNNWLIAVDTLEGLVIDGHKRLLAQLIHTGNSLELQLFGLYILGNTFLEGHSTNHVSHSVLE